MREATILALETSCDESAVAIVHRGEGGKGKILSSVISSQIDLHRAYGGVVPEVASRNHALVLRPLVEQALAESGLSISQLDAFAATRGPGLSSSLLVGHSMAKALAAAAGAPFLSVNHMEGHLLSPFLPSLENSTPLPVVNPANGIPSHVALIVSGGHTMLVKATAIGEYTLLGCTLDDAAGEAFDKVARLLGLPYPGGPEIERRALEGDPTAYEFPRSIPRELNFSFSGLKTAVRYALPAAGNLAGEIPDLCASFQQAVIDVLVSKGIRAARESGCSLLTLSGGVSCNSSLRNAVSESCERNGLDFLACPPRFSTDNAAMIAFAGLLRFEGGHRSPLTEDIDPNLSLCER